MAFHITIRAALLLVLAPLTLQGQVIETEILPEPTGQRVWSLGDEPSGSPPPVHLPSAPLSYSEAVDAGDAPIGLPTNNIPMPIHVGPAPPNISPLRDATDGSSKKSTAPPVLPDDLQPIFAPATDIPLTDPDPATVFPADIVSQEVPCDCDDDCKCETLTESPALNLFRGASGQSYPTASITGFFHLDSAWFDQDSLNRATLGDINDGLGFRRARLAAVGNVSQDIQFVLEFDFAQSQARFVDVWVQANKTRFGNVRIGRFRQPFGLSELTSVRELPFLERPLTFTQSPFRQTGVMLFDTNADETGTWAVSGYRFLSDNFGNVFADSGGYGMATRLTRIVSGSRDDRLLHLGAGYSYNDPGRGVVQLVSTNEVFVAQNPNLGPAGLSVLPIEGVTPFVNTGELSANNVQFLNFELAASLGRLALQGEARFVKVDLTNGPSAVFPGAYAQVRYMLTGETIPYNKKNGVFGRIVPDNPWSANGDGNGAWELVGRVSHIDLNDEGITGRRLTDLTAGCNWYLNRYMKIQFNYIHSRLDDVSLGRSNANTFAVRAQLDF